MKKLFSLLLFLCLALAVDAQSTNNVTIDLKDSRLQAGPYYTNRVVWVQSMSTPTMQSPSVVLGATIQGVTDTNGVLVLYNLQPAVYLVTVRAPPNQEQFKFLIQGTGLGAVNAADLLCASDTATFPAGSVAWAAAVTDQRYAHGSNYTTTFFNVTNALGYVPQPASNNLTNWSGLNTNSLLNVTAGTNAVVTTNGFLLTVNGLTDTNVVRILSTNTSAYQAQIATNSLAIALSNLYQMASVNLSNWSSLSTNILLSVGETSTAGSNVVITTSGSPLVAKVNATTDTNVVSMLSTNISAYQSKIATNQLAIANSNTFQIANLALSNVVNAASNKYYGTFVGNGASLTNITGVIPITVLDPLANYIKFTGYSFSDTNTGFNIFSVLGGSVPTININGSTVVGKTAGSSSTPLVVDGGGAFPGHFLDIQNNGVVFASVDANGIWNGNAYGMTNIWSQSIRGTLTNDTTGNALTSGTAALLASPSGSNYFNGVMGGNGYYVGNGRYFWNSAGGIFPGLIVSPSLITTQGGFQTTFHSINNGISWQWDTGPYENDKLVIDPIKGIQAAQFPGIQLSGSKFTVDSNGNINGNSYNTNNGNAFTNLNMTTVAAGGSTTSNRWNGSFSGDGSLVTGLNPAALQQDGAFPGNALVWNGAVWGPGAVSGGNGSGPFTNTVMGYANGTYPTNYVQLLSGAGFQETNANGGVTLLGGNISASNNIVAGKNGGFIGNGSSVTNQSIANLTASAAPTPSGFMFGWVAGAPAWTLNATSLTNLSPAGLSSSNSGSLGQQYYWQSGTTGYWASVPYPTAGSGITVNSNFNTASGVASFQIVNSGSSTGISTNGGSGTNNLFTTVTTVGSTNHNPFLDGYSDNDVLRIHPYGGNIEIGTNNTYIPGVVAGGVVIGNWHTMSAGASNSVMVGGLSNTVGAAYGAFAAGHYVNIPDYYDGSWVWADVGSNAQYSATATNQFSVRATGGVRFTTKTAPVSVDGNGFFAGSGSGLTNILANELSKAVNYSLQYSDAGSYFNNIGAGSPVTNTLPASYVGKVYHFYVGLANTLAVKCSNNDTIQMGTIGATAAGGSVDSATLGSSLVLHCPATNVWVAESILGTWNIH